MNEIEFCLWYAYLVVCFGLFAIRLKQQADNPYKAFYLVSFYMLFILSLCGLFFEMPQLRVLFFGIVWFPLWMHIVSVTANKIMHVIQSQSNP
jgi:hypothetical protein